MDSKDKMKLIKDNVHEYLYIDERYFSIIDSALFQRLKNVKQTSYISLYPSSTHDRFIHSLGTYYLGSRIIRGLWNNIVESEELRVINKEKNSITYTFEMACLLHDVGHAPFSHTGENFFTVKKIDSTISSYEQLKKYEEEHRVNFSYIDGLLINTIAEFYGVDLGKQNNKSGKYKTVEVFIKDFIQVLRNNSAKPHEKMSAIISLMYLKDEIQNIAQHIETTPKVVFDADLFVRCIIGAAYKINRNKESGESNLRVSFRNAVISLLNSDTIDVDKLDYILRDTYMTGYKNTGIDVERLINSFTVVVEDKQWCRRAYKKNAFSVIENVIAASDSSRRWVQNHPIVLYDSYLTQKCIGETFRILQAEKGETGSLFEKFFSVQSLTEEGVDWIDGERIYLLSDVDTVAAIKRAENIAREKNEQKSLDIFEEYFSRKIRRHSLWKSEMEFRVCFNTKLMNENEKNQLRELQNAIVSITNKKDKATNIGEYIIDEELCKKVLEENEEYPVAGKCLLENIRTYFRRIGKNIDLVILHSAGFESKMKKLSGENVYVEMPDYALDRWNCSGLYKYSDLVTIPVESTKSEDIFYFYSKENIDTKDFVSFLLTEAVFDT